MSSARERAKLLWLWLSDNTGRSGDERTRKIEAEIVSTEAAARAEGFADGQRELRLHMSDRLWVDMTPDEELPRRILEAYIDESETTDNTLGLPPENPLCVAMNKARDERNVILRAAVSNLAGGGFAEGRRRGLEEAAIWWDDTEARSAEAHAVYQQEAHRRGDVRHHDDYAQLPEATKEWDRVLVRWVAAAIRALSEKEEGDGERTD